MPLPSGDEVLQTVRTFVASFAQMSFGQVKPPMTLKNVPINLNDDKLVLLASSLRGYVKNFNTNATMKGADTKKDGLTVQGLTDVVYSRIRGKTGTIA